MSLSCANCDDHLSPSLELPGREGLIVEAMLPATYWTIEENGEFGIVNGFAQCGQGTALCLECVEKQMPAHRMHLLQHFYRMYESETEVSRIYDHYGGILPMNSSHLWSYILEDDERGAEAAKVFRSFREAWSNFGGYKECICCGGALEGSQTLPYFIGQGIDRTLCEKAVTGFGLFQPHYAWSFLHPGMSSMRICFSCIAKFFPVFLEQTTRSLGNCKLPPGQPPKMKVQIDQSMIDHVMETGDEESIKKFSESLEKIAENADLRIEPLD